MGDMQCKVEFGYHLSTLSRIEENHGKTCSSWLVVGFPGCLLTSSQQSGFACVNNN
jgi:hypothetical protein